MSNKTFLWVCLKQLKVLAEINIFVFQDLLLPQAFVEAFVKFLNVEKMRVEQTKQHLLLTLST